MKKYLISLFNMVVLVGFFVCACSMDRSDESYLTNKEDMHQLNEIAALNDIFLEFVGTENYYEPWPIEFAPPMPPGPNASREDSLRYERDAALAYEFYKTAKRKKNRNQLFISVDDSLIAFAPDSGLKKQLLNLSPDTSFFYLINSTSAIPSRSWDVASLTNTGRYIIKDKASFQQESDKQFVGSIQFSGICFDSAFTKGCLFVNLSENSLAGKWILFIIKNKDKWVILKKISL